MRKWTRSAIVLLALHGGGHQPLAAAWVSPPSQWRGYKTVLSRAWQASEHEWGYDDLPETASADLNKELSQVAETRLRDELNARSWALYLADSADEYDDGLAWSTSGKAIPPPSSEHGGLVPLLSPHPSLSPRLVIRALLGALQDNDTPSPDAGTAMLLRFASPAFKQALRDSVGTDSEAHVLTRVLGQPDRQWALLLEKYTIDFPTDVFFADADTAFQEVDLVALGADDQLDRVGGRRERGSSGDGNGSGGGGGGGGGSLGVYDISRPIDLEYGDFAAERAVQYDEPPPPVLAKIGWELVRDADTGCWMMSHITWHDFRDKFRPGLGQEEWPRICG